MARTGDSSATAQLQAFNDALDDFMRAVRRARGRLMVEGKPGELSLSQYHLLDPLERVGEALPVGELAVQAGVSPPTATRMLDALERDGLVARRRQVSDRRLVHVEVTDDGRRAVAAKRRRIASRRAQVYGSLSPAERRQAARILSGLAAAMEELR
jgi:MarR family transcriptional regulator, organic hydroperoxide resistance regulator